MEKEIINMKNCKQRKIRDFVAYSAHFRKADFFSRKEKKSILKKQKIGEWGY